MKCIETLTENELELIEMIRTHHDPTHALETAISIIIALIKDNEQKQSA